MGDEALTHFDKDGRARMVDVSGKSSTKRIAIAEGRVLMNDATFRLAQSGMAEKGDVRAVSEIAGVMAAKRTADLVPMCHPLPIDSVHVRIEPLDELSGFHVLAEVATTGRTGVEMEALTAVSVACLTLYDMLKAADRAMSIEGVRLVSKSGGASGDFTADVRD